MRELTWLDSALDDLVRLREFITKENPAAAKRAAEAIKNMAQRLIKFPHIGKPIKDLPQHYRDLLIPFGGGGYILRYRVYLEVIYVVHVRHYRELSFRNLSMEERIT